MSTDEGTDISIARGGPIFVPRLTSGLTSISDFECEIFQELQDLKAELTFHSDEEDISVDELKVFTDEELISESVKEAFKVAQKSSQQEESSNSRKEPYLEKAEELAKVRQQQKQDRAAAQLYSLKVCNKLKKHAAKSSDPDRVKSLESLRCPPKMKPSNTREHVSILDEEVVLCIEVHNTKHPMIKTQEILVLGQQKLTELKDAIQCLTNVIMVKADQHDPSGYFLIEDVFFNDMRDPSAIDYSIPILDWLRNSKEEVLAKWEYIIYGETRTNRKAYLGKKTTHVPHFRAVEMQNTRFRDLRFRVGARYLYCHQGDCKHEIVIRDMRLVHQDDCKNRAAYPLVGYQHKSRVQKCCVCQVFKATCMTIDDIGAEENPSYFCESCYLIMHFDEDRVKQYDHDMYDFIQD